MDQNRSLSFNMIFFIKKIKALDFDPPLTQSAKFEMEAEDKHGKRFKNITFSDLWG